MTFRHSTDRRGDARDLAAAGVDVVVLEARGRPGGRVAQTRLGDGRIVQLGGEVIGPGHVSYIELVRELGLTLEDAFTANPGRDTTVLSTGRVVGDGFPWMSDDDRARYDAVEQAFRELARTVDPDDPWSHEDAERLDHVSVGTWLREQGATPAVVRARELAMLALSAESVERTSLLADLRKEAAVGAHGFYGYDVWECLRVAEGSATVAERLAAELTTHIRYGTPVTAIDVTPARDRGGNPQGSIATISSPRTMVASSSSNPSVELGRATASMYPTRRTRPVMASAVDDQRYAPDMGTGRSSSAMVEPRHARIRHADGSSVTAVACSAAHRLGLQASRSTAHGASGSRSRGGRPSVSVTARTAARSSGASATSCASTCRATSRTRSELLAALEAAGAPVTTARLVVCSAWIQCSLVAAGSARRSIVCSRMRALGEVVPS